MKPRININNFFKGRSAFYYGEVFSGLGNQKMRPALNSYPSISAIKKDSTSLIDIPKQRLHFILHYLLLQQLKNSKVTSSASSFSYRRHRYFLYQYHKNFQLVNRLKGNALCLLKTKYAIKPKNPE